MTGNHKTNLVITYALMINMMMINNLFAFLAVLKRVCVQYIASNQLQYPSYSKKLLYIPTLKEVRLGSQKNLSEKSSSQEGCVNIQQEVSRLS